MTTFELNSDPDVRVLADASRSLEPQFPPPPEIWRESPFAWLGDRAIKTRGTIGEQIVEKWLSGYGFRVLPAPDSDADRVINSLRVEIKVARLSKNGTFVFNQFRDQAYDAALCLGLMPGDAYCWVIPKHVILSEPKGIRNQHGGAAGVDTWILTFRANQPHAWLNEWGGRPATARELLKRLASQNS